MKQFKVAAKQQRLVIGQSYYRSAFLKLLPDINHIYIKVYIHYEFLGYKKGICFDILPIDFSSTYNSVGIL